MKALTVCTEKTNMLNPYQAIQDMKQMSCENSPTSAHTVNS